MRQKIYKFKSYWVLAGSKAYAFLDEVYERQKPFRVIKIGKLYRVPKEGFDQWLNGVLFWPEKEMRPRITCGSYETYSSIVNNHVIPAMGNIRMTEIKRRHIQSLYYEEAAASISIARLVKTVMNTSMQYAVNKKIISINLTIDVALPKQVEKKAYHARNIDAQKTLNVEQILMLIEVSSWHE